MGPKGSWQWNQMGATLAEAGPAIAMAAARSMLPAREQTIQLLDAVHQNDIARLDDLLESGANPKSEGKASWSGRMTNVFIEAAADNHVEILRKLLE